MCSQPFKGPQLLPFRVIFLIDSLENYEFLKHERLLRSSDKARGEQQAIFYCSWKRNYRDSVFSSTQIWKLTKTEPTVATRNSSRAEGIPSLAITSSLRSGKVAFSDVLFLFFTCHPCFKWEKTLWWTRESLWLSVVNKKSNYTIHCEPCLSICVWK